MIDIQKKILKNFDAAVGISINEDDIKKHPDYNPTEDGYHYGPDEDTRYDVHIPMAVVGLTLKNKNFQIDLETEDKKLGCAIRVTIPINYFATQWDVIVDSKKRLLDAYRTMIDPYGVCDD